MAKRWKISGDDTAEWAERVQSPAQLPALVRRLLTTTLPLDAIWMRADGGVRLPGWDGEVRAQQGNPWCPAGLSFWELSVQSTSQKLESDFEKRTRGAGPTERNATYVAVLAKHFTAKEKWVADARKRGAWGDVRLFDADDLATWLEQSPAASLWMADELGRPVDDIATLYALLDAWSQKTSPPLPPELLLAGNVRRGVAEQLRTHLKTGKPGRFAIDGVPREEAMAFVAAALTLDGEPLRREQLLARAVVVEGGGSWGQLARFPDAREPLILVPTFVDPARTMSAPNSVVFVGSSDEGAAESRWLIDDFVPFEELRDQLKQLGRTEHDAQTLAAGSGGRLADLQRLLGGGALPRWADERSVGLWLALLLVGKWRPRDEGDQHVVEQLGALPLELDRFCERVSGLDEAPVRRATEFGRGSTWEWSAPASAWRSLSSRLSVHDLGRFQRVAIEVLETSDPRFDVPAAQRIAVGLGDHSKRPSAQLRGGIAETLARLGNHAPDVRAVASADRGPDIARDVVSTVLQGSWKRWAALASELPELAEAAPEEFLQAAQRSVGQPDGVARLLGEETLFSAPHVPLLHALERLAWFPRWMPRVVELLAVLAEADRGGTLGNRPLATLGAVLAPIAPQTVATQAERLGVLHQLAERHPSLAWKLVHQLIPLSHGGIIHETDRPSFLSTPALPDRPRMVSSEEAHATTSELVRRATVLARGSYERWAALLVDATKYLWADLAVFVFEAYEGGEPIPSDDTEPIWNALRDFLSDDALRPSAHPLREIATRIYKRLTPIGLAARSAWLFGGTRFNSFGTGDWRRSEEIAAEHRDEALRAIALLDDPWSELNLLAKRVTNIFSLGTHLARSPLIESLLEKFIARSLTEELHHATIVALAQLEASRGLDWFEQQLRALVEAKRVDDVVNVLIQLGPADQRWQLAERLGPSVRGGYWKSISPYLVGGLSPEALTTMLRELIDADRPAAAINSFTGSRATEFPSKLLVALLEALALNAEESETKAFLRSGGAGWAIEQAFLAIDRAGDIDRARLAKLEIKFFNFLVESPRSTRALYELLAQSPAEFVSLLELIYRGESAASDDVPPVTDDVLALKVEAARKILGRWIGYPGEGRSSSERETKLEQWSAEAIALATQSGRGRIGRHAVAEVLARAPAAEDGVWPALAARRLLEREVTDELAFALEIARRRARGVTTRKIGEGGDQEHRIAIGYLRDANLLRPEWPRTAAVLDRLAERYDRDARHENDSASTERRRWGIDRLREEQTSAQRKRPDLNAATQLNQVRKQIAERVRDLRTVRGWTQADLAQRLGLSEDRLSEIEQGGGSFTAEQFVLILQHLNVAASELAPPSPERRDEDKLQNRLARLGASNLRENSDVLPSERLADVEGVVHETLIEAESPRLFAALAPVLVRYASKLRAQKLAPLGLTDARYVRRLRWALDNTLAALASEASASLQRVWAKSYERARVKLTEIARDLDARYPNVLSDIERSPFDALDTSVRSERSLEETVAEASPISKRWRIATSLQIADFAAALRGARDAA